MSDITITEGGDGTTRATCLDCQWASPPTVYPARARSTASDHVAAFPGHAVMCITASVALVHVPLKEKAL